MSIDAPQFAAPELLAVTMLVYASDAEVEELFEAIKGIIEPTDEGPENAFGGLLLKQDELTAYGSRFDCEDLHDTEHTLLAVVGECTVVVCRVGVIDDLGDCKGVR